MIKDYAPSGTELPRQLTNDKAVLTLIGSFWSNYYRDTVTLNSLETGAFWLAQTEYDRVLKAAMSSSILTIPEYQTQAYALHIFDLSKLVLVGTNDYFTYPYPNGDDIPFLTSSLLEPAVILEKGVHYDIGDGVIKFYVNLATDSMLSTNAYSASGNYMLLWAVDTVVQEYFIYDRFGVFMYDKLQDNAVSKLMYTALQYFFTNQKTVKNIEFAINALLGMPYSTTDCGFVQNVTSTSIVTSKHIFTKSSDSEALVAPGDSVPPFTLLARIVKVDDYLTDPDWYIGKEFPFKFMPHLFVCFNSVYQNILYFDGVRNFDGNEYFHKYDDAYQINPDVIYEPIKFDGSLTFKGLYNTDEVPLKSPTTMDEGTPLYNFMHNYIKHNVIAMHSTRDGVDLDTLFKHLHPGMPSYLNYVTY